LDRYDSAYLFTGDADFLQALFSIKKFHNKKKINIISLQNKVLFRGAFFFKTYILILNQILLNKLKFRDFQKHEFIYVSSEVIIKDV